MQNMIYVRRLVSLYVGRSESAVWNSCVYWAPELVRCWALSSTPTLKTSFPIILVCFSPSLKPQMTSIRWWYRSWNVAHILPILLSWSVQTPTLHNIHNSYMKMSSPCLIIMTKVIYQTSTIFVPCISQCKNRLLSPFEKCNKIQSCCCGPMKMKRKRHKSWDRIKRSRGHKIWDNVAKGKGYVFPSYHDLGL